MRTVLFLFASVAIACPLIASAAVVVSCHSRAVAVLERWAKREGYRVVRRSRRHFFRGPFSGMPSTHFVFRVVLEDQDGLGSVAWVDCGDLYWDDSPTPEVERSLGP